MAIMHWWWKVQSAGVPTSLGMQLNMSHHTKKPNDQISKSYLQCWVIQKALSLNKIAFLYEDKSHLDTCCVLFISAGWSERSTLSSSVFSSHWNLLTSSLLTMNSLTRDSALLSSRFGMQWPNNRPKETSWSKAPLMTTRFEYEIVNCLVDSVPPFTLQKRPTHFPHPSF